MAVWHATLGRHGVDGAPPPEHGQPTLPRNARIMTRVEALRYADKGVVDHFHPVGHDDYNGMWEVSFKRGKMPEELR